MRIQTEYMSFKNRWTISSSYDFQAHQQHSRRRCCVSQTALLWFEVLPDMSPALPGAPRLVVGAPSYSKGWQECPPKVWYSPEIDASKFTLHILSDTPGGFKRLKFNLLMYATRPIAWATGSIYFSVRGYKAPSEPSEPFRTPGSFRQKLELLLMNIM